MGVINEISPIGRAYPEHKYPNPVKTTRTNIIALGRAESQGADMNSMDDVIAAISSNLEAIEWLQKNWDEYLRGIEGAGFEVKRYRIALYFKNGTEDTVLPLKEGESAKEMTEMATDMLRTYQKHGYITKREEDKSTGIYMEVLDSAGGGKVQKQYARLKVNVIRPSDYTPAKETRYPSPEDIERQRLEAKVISAANAATP